MGIEIERKFLVKKEIWNQSKPENGTRIVQGYLSKSKEKTVRVRVKGEKGFIAIKSETVGFTRKEFEYEIPMEDAKELLDLFCPQRIDKMRYKVKSGNSLWEVDEFSSPQKDLILAEIEVQYEAERVDFPEWIGEEVSHIPKYYNANMI